MPAGSTLRFDDVPIEDFLVCVGQYEKDVRLGFLPRPHFLKEVKIKGLWGPKEIQEKATLSVYILQETDAVSERTEAFLIFHGESRSAPALRTLAVKIRTFLEGKRIPSLFRMDPQYGLVYGSALEPVDPTVKWDRPGAYVTLYLTGIASSPSLALMEYVSPDNQKRYRDLFVQYNRVQPETPSLLKTTWQFLRGRSKEVSDPRRLNYKLIRLLIEALGRESIENVKISLIYKDLSQPDVQSVLVDPRYLLFAPSGQDRFFASLGELA